MDEVGTSCLEHVPALSDHLGGKKRILLFHIERFGLEGIL